MKTCEACGLAFSCGGYGCWCGQVAITERQMDWIAAKYHDCLCPACLQKISRGELGPAPDVLPPLPTEDRNKQGGIPGG